MAFYYLQNKRPFACSKCLQSRGKRYEISNVQIQFKAISTNFFFPQPHFSRYVIPTINRAISNIIPIIIFRPRSNECLPKRYINPSSLPFAFTFPRPLRNTMQPILLRLALHQHHITTSQLKFQRLRYFSTPSTLPCYCRKRFMLHQKIATRT